MGYLENYPSHVIQLVGKSQLSRLGSIVDLGLVVRSEMSLREKQRLWKRYPY